MCVCMYYVLMYVCMYVCIYVRICVRICVYVFVLCMYVCVYLCMCVCMYARRSLKNLFTFTQIKAHIMFYLCIIASVLIYKIVL